MIRFVTGSVRSGIFSGCRFFGFFCIFMVVSLSKLGNTSPLSTTSLELNWGMCSMDWFAWNDFQVFYSECLLLAFDRFASSSYRRRIFDGWLLKARSSSCRTSFDECWLRKENGMENFDSKIGWCEIFRPASDALVTRLMTEIWFSRILLGKYLVKAAQRHILFCWVESSCNHMFYCG